MYFLSEYERQSVSLLFINWLSFLNSFKRQYEINMDWETIQVLCLINIEACIGVLGIHDICHFTSRDIGYFPFYFQGYGIVCSIFGSLSGILNILEN